MYNVFRKLIAHRSFCDIYLDSASIFFFFVLTFFFCSNLCYTFDLYAAHTPTSHGHINCVLHTDIQSTAHWKTASYLSCNRNNKHTFISVCVCKICFFFAIIFFSLHCNTAAHLQCVIVTSGSRTYDRSLNVKQVHLNLYFTLPLNK